MSNTGKAAVPAPPQFSWSEIDPRDVPDQDYLVDRILPARGCHLLVSPPKKGKSRLLAHLVACFIAGKPLFGRYEIARKLGEGFRILVIMAEETPHKFRARVEANLRGFGWSEEELQALDPAESIVVSGIKLEPGAEKGERWFRLPHHRKWLRQMATEFDLIVLDSLRPAHGRNENDSTDMKSVTDLMRELAAFTCFLIVHHTGHQDPAFKRVGADQARGTSDLDAARDTTLVIESGGFGGLVTLGVYHRDDAELHIALTTQGERHPQLARWVAEAEGSREDIKGKQRVDKLMERIHAAKSLEELPKKSNAKGFFGDDYTKVLRALAETKMIVGVQAASKGRPGRPAILLMEPGQFAVPSDDLVPPSEL